ncbi:MAG: response regulator transcription factor [Actinobacteria bacterium]|nr:response regulator transcription factor [Actinomycetota bacterium]
MGAGRARSDSGPRHRRGRRGAAPGQAARGVLPRAEAGSRRGRARRPRPGARLPHRPRAGEVGRTRLARAARARRHDPARPRRGRRHDRAERPPDRLLGDPPWGGRGDDPRWRRAGRACDPLPTGPRQVGGVLSQAVAVGTGGGRRAGAGTVLIVEDEHSIGALIRSYLSRDGYGVVWVRSGEEALIELVRHPVRIVVLDIGLPGMDGFEVCRQIRARSSVPIVMVTARDEEPDRVAGLEVGADDYVPKPFSPRELVARVKAILRRSEPAIAEPIMSLGDIVLDLQGREVAVGGEPVELTTKEFDLLVCLMENPGIVLSRDTLLDRAWGTTYPGGTRTVDVHVGQLRKKLGRPALIRTVRGAGYKAVKS